MSPNCSHSHIEKMPSGIVKCLCCNAIDTRFYGHWWPSVFPWAKDMKITGLERGLGIPDNIKRYEIQNTKTTVGSSYKL